MGDDGRSQMRYRQHNGESMSNCPSSNMNTRPMITHLGSGSGWDPMVSIGRSDNLTKSSSFANLPESQEFSSSSHLVNCSSDTNRLARVLPMSSVSMFESGNIHELVNPFDLPLSSQTPNAFFPRNSTSTNSRMDEKPSLQADRVCQVLGGRIEGVSPNGKRNRDSEPKSSVTKIAEGNMQCETLGSSEQDDKRQKQEQNAAANSSGKQASKQVEDNSQGEEASKKDYIHVRARRGQATNSHSLAERVRREKISERMRLLQDLVPGCNKITGKAVMLDEIINYVQSLQQQVEFLSMKLSTVNPELNIDIDRLLPKDMLQSQGSGPPILGFDHGMNSSHGFPLGTHQTLTAMPNTASHYHHMTQTVWDGDLQSLLQMGFDSNTAVGAFGSSNDTSKNEL